MNYKKFLIFLFLALAYLVPIAHADGPHNQGRTDMFYAPPSQILELQENEPLPKLHQTSEFMLGSVAVDIILPESNGGFDPNVENWTPAERSQVCAEVKEGVNWWKQFAPGGKLQFVFNNENCNTSPVTLEPILRNYEDQQYWINQVMTARGITEPTYFDQVRRNNNNLRQSYGTDWAFTVFVVDSTVDVDGMFANEYFAYAYFGGPFVVMTLDNDGYGIDNMDAVTAHEMGHTFRALDQYEGAASGCTARSGYLYEENQNSEYHPNGPCLSDVDSIMRGQVWPYEEDAVDKHAERQAGLSDTDNDGVADTVDVTITATAQLTVTESLVRVAGVVEEHPLPSNNPNIETVLINKIQQIEYRVNGGTWQATSATDGTFNSYLEQFHFQVARNENMRIEMRVVDSFGNIRLYVIFDNSHKLFIPIIF